MDFLSVPPPQDARGVILDQLTLVRPAPNEAEIESAVTMGTLLFCVCNLANEHELCQQLFPTLLAAMMRGQA